MAVPVSNAAAEPYEELLLRDTGYVMEEAGRFFDGQSKVHQALQKITARLVNLDVPYALVGGMALSAHGYIRTTDDVDLLVTPEDLKIIHEALDGLGYVPPFVGSKQLRDVSHGVKIEFLITGGFPGDGKPKPIAFPDPRDAAVSLQGLQVLALPKLIELKLASGMTNPQRLKDLADVQELARILKLEPAYADQLDPWVRDKFLELIGHR